jgi:hypothetical protein
LKETYDLVHKFFTDVYYVKFNLFLGRSKLSPTAAHYMYDYLKKTDVINMIKINANLNDVNIEYHDIKKKICSSMTYQ